MSSGVVDYDSRFTIFNFARREEVACPRLFACAAGACGGRDANLSLTGASGLGGGTAAAGATITGCVNAGSALAQAF